MSLRAQTQTLQITNIPADRMQALKALKCEYGYVREH